MFLTVSTDVLVLSNLIPGIFQEYQLITPKEESRGMTDFL
jgi:hypothetical protein